MTDPFVTGPLVVVAGVSGTGKSTVGLLLAQRLGVPFADADDLHSAAEIASMAAGRPLTEQERLPWLDRVGEALAGAESSGMVMACSALRRTYRDRLRRWSPQVDVLLLDGAHDLVVQRQAARRGHFMPTTLMGSQYATLEPMGVGERGLTLDVSAAPEEIVTAWLTARGSTAAGTGAG